MLDQKAAAEYACDRLDAFRLVHSGSDADTLQESVDTWLQEGLGINPEAWDVLKQRLRPEFEDHLGAVMVGIILAFYMVEYGRN